MKFLDKFKETSHASLPVKIGAVFFFGVLAVAALGGVASLVGFLLQWLWNATVTAIFETTPITWWQALLLLVLCKILFGNEYKVHMHGRKRRGHGEE